MDTILSDKEGFKLIYIKYWRLLLFYLWKKTDRRDVAEDIVQECFTELWECRHTIESLEHVKNFLYKVANHRLIDYIRKNKVKEHNEREYTRLADIPDNVDAEWVFCQVIDALGLLSEKDRDALLSSLNGRGQTRKSNAEYLVICRAKAKIKNILSKALSYVLCI